MGSRKYFLDWLRVLAFALLILFHTGMLYVTWRYALKSPRPVAGLEWAMTALSPWRMPLIFLIAGVACRHLLAKLGPGRFLADRLRRLLPVLLFGMFVVNPPQIWVELLDKGLIHMGYAEFWLGHYLAFDEAMVRPLHKPIPAWDHLWFLVYLLLYTTALAPLWKLTHWRGEAAPRPARSSRSVLLVLPGAWLAASAVAMARWWPRTDGLIGDWGAHLQWIGMFATGIAFAMREDVWAWMCDRRGWLALMALALLSVHLAFYTTWDASGRPPHWNWLGDGLAEGAYAWTAVLCVAGYAARYLNRPSALLSWLNEAILPVYVVHQPILLVSAYFLFPLRLPLEQEAALLVAITASGSFALYRFAIRPYRVMRFLFGLKAHRDRG